MTSLAKFFRIKLSSSLANFSATILANKSGGILPHNTFFLEFGFPASLKRLDMLFCTLLLNFLSVFLFLGLQLPQFQTPIVAPQLHSNVSSPVGRARPARPTLSLPGTRALGARRYLERSHPSAAQAATGATHSPASGLSCDAARVFFPLFKVFLLMAR